MFTPAVGAPVTAPQYPEFPEFYDRQIVDVAASEKEGRVIHKTVPYIKVVFPGDKTKVMDTPVDFVGQPGIKPSHPNRWPKQWADYQAQREQVADGTSLLEWPPLPRAEAMDLKAMKIHTVEQLAGLPDNALTWLGARSLKDKAQLWLDQAKGGAGITKLQAENDALRSDLEMMKQQIKDLAALKTPDAEKRGPGRPKNTSEGE
jgi:hypothetical protein